jgi:hypothetical protein
MGFMLAVFVALLLKKQVRRALMACVWFLAGMAAATAPWLVYFAVHGALDDWFHAYFTLNITAYAKTTGVVAIFRAAWQQFYAEVLASPALLYSMLLGVAGFVGIRRMLPGVWSRICLWLLPALLTLGVYGGGRSYPYYFLAVMGMTMLPGMIVLARVLSGVAAWFRRSTVGARPKPPRWRGALAAVGCAVLLAASAWYAYGHYQYRDFMETDRAELAQTRFAAIMNGEKDPTLLNYGFLDGGFYTAADILPTTKYFCRLNMRLPEMTAAQDAAIRDKAVMFVVTRSGGKGQDAQSALLLRENYALVAQAEQEFEHRHFTYSLYRRKEA